MKSFTILSLLAVTAVAQQQQQQQSPATSPLIPDGISAGCKAALQTFDADTSLQGCTSSIIKATKEYTGGQTPTEAGMTSALDVLCSATSCSETTVRTILSQFSQSCQAELTSAPNKEVISLYEVIYTIIPFRGAVCTKDDSSKYCALQIPARVSGGNSTATPGNAKVNLLSTGVSPADAKNYLDVSRSVSRRADGDTYQIINGTTFSSTNLLFLFLSPNLPSATLCTSCTKNVMTGYINFESDVPYAPAKDQSQLLSGQTALYNGIQSTCGASFLLGAVQAAGGLGNNGLKFSGASSSISMSGSLSLGLGVVTLFLAAFL